MATFWPRVDFFSEEGAGHGVNLLGYLGCSPSSVSFTPGRLHDGYPGGAAFRGQNQTGDFDKPCGVVRRDNAFEDVKVVLSSRKRMIAGNPDPGFLLSHGCFLRVQNGTIADDGTVDVRLEDCDCYLGAIIRQPSGKVRGQVVRYNAGVPTLIGESDEFTPAAGAFFTDFAVAFQAETNGAQVDLTLFITGFASEENIGLAGPGGGPGITVSGTPVQGFIQREDLNPPPESILVQVMDTDVNRIVGAGKAGFGIDREATYNTSDQTISTASYFEILSIASNPLGDLIWRDEFERAAPSHQDLLPVDFYGTLGRSLQSDYGGDQHSSTVGTLEPIIQQGPFFIQSLQTESMGQTSRLDGFGTPEADKLVLQTPGNIFPAPDPADSAEWTVSVWALIQENRNGNGLYKSIDEGPNPDVGFSFGLITQPDIGGQAAAAFEITLGGQATPQVFLSSAFVIADRLGEPFCYCVSYKANTNAVTGAGRLRCYIGRGGVAELVDEITVPSATRPRWNQAGPHILGEREDDSGSQTERAFFGDLDEPFISFSELAIEDVARLCDPYREVTTAFPPIPSAYWNFDSWSGVAPNEESALTIPSLSAPWRYQDASVGAGVSPGLLPERPVTKLIALHQRPVEDPINQQRSIQGVLKAPLDRLGVCVRVGPVADPKHYAGYRLEVSAGDPAFVRIVRVNVDGPVQGQFSSRELVLAQQNPSTGNVAVALNNLFTSEIEVVQQNSDPGGNVAIEVKIDTLLVQMEPVSSQASIDLNGRIIDQGVERILSGPATGWELLSTSSNPCQLDTWTDTPPDSQEPGADVFPGYPIPNEADNAFGNLEDVLVPSFSITVERALPRQDVDFYQPLQVRQRMDTFVRRVFACQLEGGTTAEVAALEAFFDSHQGRVLPFNFAVSQYLRGELDGVFKFTEDSLRYGWRRKARVISFGLEEQVPVPS